MNINLIPVTANLPILTKPCLVVTTENQMRFYHIAEYFFDKEGGEWATHSETLHYVTHWQYIDALCLEWISMEEIPLKETDAMEVIAFHPEWIHEDFNPNGTRVGFIGAEGEFISAKWCNDQDTYENCEKLLPTHYMFMPKNPMSILEPSF